MSNRKVHGGHKKSFPIYKDAAAIPLNQSNQNVRYGSSKICARDFDDQKQRTASGYSCSQTNSKISNRNTLFCIEKWSIQLTTINDVGKALAEQKLMAKCANKMQISLKEISLYMKF